jgi:hypothetical protein
MKILEVYSKGPIGPRKKTRRAFTGLAGSPLAKIDKALLSATKSDFALRTPLTPDRQKPTAFDRWYDEFGDRHGQIDLDCAFQTYAFDEHLGQGHSPADSNGGHAGALNIQHSGEATLPQAFNYDPEVGESADNKKGYSTGLLEHERPEKPRRATPKTWWIFDEDLLKQFLNVMWTHDNPDKAKRAAWILYSFYVRNRTDEELATNEVYLQNDDFYQSHIPERTEFEFSSAKQVKRARQYLVRLGTAMFGTKDLPELTRKQGRGRWRGEHCNNPECKQCINNEKGWDYGRM